MKALRLQVDIEKILGHLCLISNVMGVHIRWAYVGVSRAPIWDDFNRKKRKLVCKRICGAYGAVRRIQAWGYVDFLLEMLPRTVHPDTYTKLLSQILTA
jgi:hypothetical protein